MKKLEPVVKQEKETRLSTSCEKDIEILARTIWGEARGEGQKGMLAVASVIMNRVRRGGWWGSTIQGVCRKPYQFSCWNKDDPNARLLQSVTEKDLQFATALRIARRAVYRAMIDVTNGADHYHAIGVIPLWSKGERPVAVIGNHIFYKLTKGKNHV